MIHNSNMRVVVATKVVVMGVVEEQELEQQLLE
jgi:hypothetical protein